jgi:hypothetical protein
MATMESLRERVEQRVPVGDILEAVLHETGYLEWLEAERTIEAQGRMENLQELVEVAREFDAAAEAPEDTLDVFLQQVALVADADTRRDDEGLVTLMTLHNAKGLEYPIVFIIGCEEGVFPHSRSLDEGTLEEERRLMYVGITRAMRDLTLTYARRRAVYGGAPNYGLPSRFLAELPPDLVDRESPGRRRGAARRWRAHPAPRATSWSAAGARLAGRGRGGAARLSARATTCGTRRSATGWSRSSSRGIVVGPLRRTARSASSCRVRPDHQRCMTPCLPSRPAARSSTAGERRCAARHGRGRRALRRRHPPARPGHRLIGDDAGLAGLRRRQASAPARRSGSRASTTACPPAPARGRRGLSTSSTPTRGRAGSSASSRCPPRSTAWR